MGNVANPEPALEPFKKGDKVVIRGMGLEGLNGQKGKIRGWIRSRKRWEVLVENFVPTPGSWSPLKALKTANLIHLNQAVKKTKKKTNKQKSDPFFNTDMLKAVNPFDTNLLAAAWKNPKAAFTGRPYPEANA